MLDPVDLQLGFPADHDDREQGLLLVACEDRSTDPRALLALRNVNSNDEPCHVLVPLPVFCEVMETDTERTNALYFL
jgi:hypothetical protein